MDSLVKNELVDGLKTIFTDKLISIILYGSVARGADTDESDVDIAIILKDSKKQQFHKLIDFTVDLDLKYNKVFSVIDIDYDEFQKWEDILPFFKSIKRDGVLLWTVV